MCVQVCLSTVPQTGRLGFKLGIYFEPNTLAATSSRLISDTPDSQFLVSVSSLLT